MKASGIFLVFAGVVAGLALAAITLGAVIFVENQHLRREVGDLRLEREAAIEARAAAELQQADTEAKLAAQQQQISQLQQELTSARAEQEAATAPGEAERRAQRAHIYAGQRLLGDGWILPRAASAGTNTVATPPVVLLDQTLLRTMVAAAVKEASSQERSTPTTVNYNYPQPYYYGGNWWPVTWFTTPSPTNDLPDGDRFPKPPPRVPQDSRTFNGSGIWRPTSKPFLPNPSDWPIMTPNQATVPSVRISPGFSSRRVAPAAPIPSPAPISRTVPIQPLRR